MAITKSVRKKIVLAAVLLALLLGLLLYFLYYDSTKKLTFDVVGTTADALEPPVFLYSFAGAGSNRLQAPVGIYADKDAKLVYVCDTQFRKVLVFEEGGKYLRSFGQGEIGMPLYITKNPIDGNIYISDRDKFTIWIYTSEGKKVGEYKPKIPKDEMPNKKLAGGLSWKPRAMAFDERGALYVTDFILMRVVAFNPDGSFKFSYGTQGMVNDRRKAVQAMYYPSAIAVREKMVYVADSNNGRVLVLTDAGKYKRVIVTTGLPRGVDVLDPFAGQKSTIGRRVVSADTLGHMGNIWSDKSQSLAQFGTNGVLEGQFNYPEGLSIGAKNKIFVSDTKNGRVQVWGWPEQISPVPLPKVPSYWYYCLIPLLFLPVLLFGRKRKVFITTTFLEEMLETKEGRYALLNARVNWYVLPVTYTQFADLDVDGTRLGRVLTQTQYSDSDVRAMMKKYEIPEEMAIDLAVAARVQILGTVDADERKYARIAEIDVVNPAEAIVRFTPKSRPKQASHKNDDI